MGDAQHPREALQDLLDDRLDPAARGELEGHLASCERCRGEIAALQWTKARVGSLKNLEETPGLEARLRLGLDDEDRARGGFPKVPASRKRLVRMAPWLAAAAAVVALAWLGGRFWTRSVPELVADDYRAYASNALSLEAESVDPVELEGFFRRSSLPFAVRVFDLGMMAYRLEGGRVHRVRGRDSALIAYRGADGRVLLCQMYQGNVADLPEPLDRRTNQNIEFQLYRDGELTLVFWQEGSVVCVLAAEGDPEAVIQLAFAKAVAL